MNSYKAPEKTTRFGLSFNDSFTTPYSDKIFYYWPEVCFEASDRSTQVGQTLLRGTESCIFAEAKFLDKDWKADLM